MHAQRRGRRREKGFDGSRHDVRRFVHDDVVAVFVLPRKASHQHEKHEKINILKADIRSAFFCRIRMTREALRYL